LLGGIVASAAMLTTFSLERLPIPARLELPRFTLGLIPLVCLLLLAFVVHRVRVGPRSLGLWSFLVLVLAGSALQFTDLWWQYSLLVLLLMTAATLFTVVEILARPSLRPQRPAVATAAAIDAGAYLYLVAVLSAYS
jgi:hypothetical protein